MIALALSMYPISIFTKLDIIITTINKLKTTKYLDLITTQDVKKSPIINKQPRPANKAYIKPLRLSPTNNERGKILPVKLYKMNIKVYKYTPKSIALFFFIL